jgi:hypothetical protein
MSNEKRYDEHGMRLTNCCGAHSTYVDEVLCCKICYEETPIGQGDGNEFIDTVITVLCEENGNNKKYMVLRKSEMEMARIKKRLEK